MRVSRVATQDTQSTHASEAGLCSLCCPRATGPAVGQTPKPGKGSLLPPPLSLLSRLPVLILLPSQLLLLLLLHVEPLQEGLPCGFVLLLLLQLLQRARAGSSPPMHLEDGHVLLHAARRPCRGRTVPPVLEPLCGLKEDWGRWARVYVTVACNLSGQQVLILAGLVRLSCTPCLAERDTAQLVGHMLRTCTAATAAQCLSTKNHPPHGT